jgi:hypothetical protein
VTLRTALGLCGLLFVLGCQPESPALDSTSAEVQAVFSESVDEPLQSKGLQNLICTELGPGLTVSCDSLQMMVKRIVSSNLYFHSDGFPLTMQLEVEIIDAKTPRTYKAILTRSSIQNWKLMFNAQIFTVK